MNFPELIKQISDILYQVDIMNIGGNDNEDEYDPEAEDIAKRLPDISGQQELQEQIFYCFQDWFRHCNPEENDPRYQTAAQQIWKLWREQNDKNKAKL